MVGIVSVGAIIMACYIWLLKKILEKRNQDLEQTQKDAKSDVEKAQSDAEKAQSDADKALNAYTDIQKQLEKALSDQHADRLSHQVEVNGLRASNRQLRADLYPTYE